MKAWRTSCVDWASRLRAGKSIIPPPIFPEQAAIALGIFKQLRIVDAPGSPTFGESCADWVFDLVASIFGAYDATTGRRLITEWFVLIPKKNSKSTVAAGIMMTALILNWRESAEFSILAPTIEIANNSYAPARDMCADRHSEELAALMHVQNHVKTITHRSTNASLKVIAADAKTVGGKKSVGTLVDELWLLGQEANADNMLREATGGLASRPEGFVIYLTTQSDDPPAGVFASKLKYARDVRDGKIEDKRFCPVLYEFPDAMVKSGAHRKPENLRIVNPNMGRSVDEEFLRRELKKAETDGEEAMRGFFAKHGNVEVGMALRSDRWAGADFWQACAVSSLTLDELMARSDVVVCGIDGGGLDDLLGFVAMGRDSVSRKWLVWAHAWAHKIVLERRKSIASALEDFAADGDLTLCETSGSQGLPGEDVRAVADVICRIRDAGLLPPKHAVGVDAVGIGDIVDALTADARGIALEQIVAVSQGWKLNGAIKTTERKLAGLELEHSGSRLMAWCVSNARVVPAGNAITITKQASGTAKIDPVMALFDAASLMAMNPESSKPVLAFF